MADLQRSGAFAATIPLQTDVNTMSGLSFLSEKEH